MCYNSAKEILNILISYILDKKDAVNESNSYEILRKLYTKYIYITCVCN